jgi:hypothetical protein
MKGYNATIIANIGRNFSSQEERYQAGKPATGSRRIEVSNHGTAPTT